MRLFVAFDFEPQLKQQISSLLSKLQPMAKKAKWVRGENLHVTLAFLGSVPDERLSEIENAIASSLAGAEAASLWLAGGGVFGSKKNPRVLWLSIGGDLERVRHLQASLEEGLRPFGYEPEHEAYTPHLTLARSREPSGDHQLARCLPGVEAASFGDFELKEIVLYRSDLSPTGPTYTPLRTFPVSPSLDKAKR